jgi:hypothetical protein
MGESHKADMNVASSFFNIPSKERQGIHTTFDSVANDPGPTHPSPAARNRHPQPLEPVVQSHRRAIPFPRWFNHKMKETQGDEEHEEGHKPSR